MRNVASSFWYAASHAAESLRFASRWGRRGRVLHARWWSRACCSRWVAGALGLAAAYGGLRLLVAAEPANLPRLSEISLDPAALLFALGVTLLCGPLFSLLPIAKTVARASLRR